MRQRDGKHMSIYLSNEQHFKLHYISAYEGRSAHAQVLYEIRRLINGFEKEHGKIDVEKTDE